MRQAIDREEEEEKKKMNKVYANHNYISLFDFNYHCVVVVIFSSSFFFLQNIRRSNWPQAKYIMQPPQVKLSMNEWN